MQITINPPTFMWFLPNASVHLTDGNPGPVEIDFKSLSKENQKLVIIGIRNKQIKASESELNLLDILNDKQPSHTAVNPIATFNTDDEHPLIESEEDLKVLASTTLNKVATTIKKNIESSTDIRLMRIMLELEKNTRNRKSIVSCIENRLNLLSESVLKDINKHSISNTKYSDIDSLAGNMEVTESDTEERVVEL
jgi:hypothetical protein